MATIHLDMAVDPIDEPVETGRASRGDAPCSGRRERLLRHQFPIPTTAPGHHSKLLYRDCYWGLTKQIRSPLGARIAS